MKPLTGLLDSLTVRLEQGNSKGTGFFVAPGLVLTCAHVVEQSNEVTCWFGETSIKGKVIKSFLKDEKYPDARYPDIGLVEIKTTDHLCVLFGESLEIGDDLYTYGYSDQSPGGDPATLQYEGRSDDPPRLKLKEGQIRPGVSGAPILNLRTGAVCGMTSISRGRSSALGARGVPLDVIKRWLPDIARLQKEFHKGNREWLDRLSLEQKEMVAGRVRSRVGLGSGAVALAAVAFGVPLYLFLLDTDETPFSPWEVVDLHGGVVRSIAIDATNPDKLFAGLELGDGVFKSNDRGLSWRPISDGLGATDIKDLYLSPHNNSLTAATNNGLWVSQDDGQSWNQRPGSDGKSFLMIEGSPLDPRFIVAGSQKSGGASAGAVTASAAAENRGIDLRPGFDGGHLHLSQDTGSTWQTLPVEAGFHGAAFSRQDSRLVYITSADQNSIWRISDPSRGPERLKNFPGNVPDEIAVAPDDDKFVIVGARDGLYVSRDGGHSWDKDRHIGDVTVADVTASLDGQLYAATVDGLFESQDGGVTWSSSKALLPYRRTFAVATTTSDDIYLGTDGGGIFRRFAGQRDWTAISSGLPPIACFDITVDAERFFASCSNGLFVSNDRGRTWNVSALHAQPVFQALASPSADMPSGQRISNLQIGNEGGSSGQIVTGDLDGLRILARVHRLGSRGRLIHSNDGGRYWNDVENLDNDVIALFEGASPSTVFASTGGEVFRSDDFGDSWRPLAGIPENNLVTSGAAASGRILLGTYSGGLLVSEDGTNWFSSEGLDVNCEPITSIITHSTIPDRIYTATGDGCVFKSDDGGKLFQKLNSPVDQSSAQDGERATLAISTGSNEMLFLGTWRGVYWSENDGVTWELLPVGELGENYRVNNLRILNSPEPTLYAGTELAMLRVALASISR